MKKCRRQGEGVEESEREGERERGSEREREGCAPLDSHDTIGHGHE